MQEKLNIIYPFVEPAGPQTFLVGYDGKQGLFQNGKLVLPVAYQRIRLMELFIVAGISDGFGYAAVFNQKAQRLIPAPGAARDLAEVHAVTAWPGVGLILLMKEPPTHKNPLTLVLLHNNGDKRTYPEVNRQPLFVGDTGLRAIVRPGRKPKVNQFDITLAQCILELESGNLLEVLDGDFTSYSAGMLRARLPGGAP